MSRILVLVIIGVFVISCCNDCDPPPGFVLDIRDSYHGTFEVFENYNSDNETTSLAYISWVFSDVTFRMEIDSLDFVPETDVKICNSSGIYGITSTIDFLTDSVYQDCHTGFIVDSAFTLIRSANSDTLTFRNITSETNLLKEIKLYRD